MTTTLRKATNVSLPQDLVAKAKELEINVSKACEAGLAEAVRAERIARWKAENAGAIADYNEYVEKHGLPLARHRMF